MRFLFYVALSMMCTLLHAGSVRLINNSSYDLRAVIRGSDGSYLGEVVVPAQNSISWQDSYGSVGQSRGPNAQMESGYRSKTPYSVLWYCMDGKDYGLCDTVSTGAVVLSQGCAGARQCNPPKKNKYPTTPGEHNINPSPENASP